MSTERPLLVIYSHKAEHTTARYFERAAKARGDMRTLYVSNPNKLPPLGAPDLLFVIDPVSDWPLGIERLECRKAIYLIDVHQDYAYRRHMAFWFDAIFCAQKDYVGRFMNDGIGRVRWLPHAGDANVHFAPGADRDIDVSFVGNTGVPGSNRHEILSDVLPHFATNDVGRWHSPHEMGRIYSRSKVVFNASIGGDLNMRVFEAMSAGAALVTDRIGNGLDHLFREGRHYLGYESVEEARDAIARLLENRPQREGIARAGQTLVMKEHLYQHRFDTVVAHARSQPRGTNAAARAVRAELRWAYAKLFTALRRPDRLIASMAKYGVDVVTLWAAACAGAAWLNRRIPLTPSAIRHRLRKGRASVLARRRVPL